MDDFITPSAHPSYASGISEVPLLGDTIGDNFADGLTSSCEPRLTPWRSA